MNDTIEYYYSEDELKKMLNALREKYGISECEELPYRPAVTKIRIFGEVVHNPTTHSH